MSLPINIINSDSDPFLTLNLEVDGHEASITVTVSFEGDLLGALGSDGETEEGVRTEVAQDILYLVYSEFSTALEDAKSHAETSA